jgi:hypothetical protein
VKAIQEGVAALTDAELNKLMTSGSTVVAGETLTLEEVMVRRTFRGDATIYEVYNTTTVLLLNPLVLTVLESSVVVRCLVQ